MCAPHTSFLFTVLKERDSRKLLCYFLVASRVRLNFFDLSVVILGESESIISLFLVCIKSVCLVRIQFPLQWIFLELIVSVVNSITRLNNLNCDPPVALMWVFDNLHKSSSFLVKWDDLIVLLIEFVD